MKGPVTTATIAVGPDEAFVESATSTEAAALLRGAASDEVGAPDASGSLAVRFAKQARRGEGLRGPRLDGCTLLCCVACCCLLHPATRRVPSPWPGNLSCGHHLSHQPIITPWPLV